MKAKRTEKIKFLINDKENAVTAFKNAAGWIDENKKLTRKELVSQFPELKELQFIFNHETLEIEIFEDVPPLGAA